MEGALDWLRGQCTAVAGVGRFLYLCADPGTGADVTAGDGVPVDPGSLDSRRTFLRHR